MIISATTWSTKSSRQIHTEIQWMCWRQHPTRWIHIKWFSVRSTAVSGPLSGDELNRDRGKKRKRRKEKEKERKGEIEKEEERERERARERSDILEIPCLKNDTRKEKTKRGKNGPRKKILRMGRRYCLYRHADALYQAEVGTNHEGKKRWLVPPFTLSTTAPKTRQLWFAVTWSSLSASSFFSLVDEVIIEYASSASESNGPSLIFEGNHSSRSAN